MDVGIMRELALQISGISKIVYSGGGRRRATALEPRPVPDEGLQDERAAAR